MPVPRPLDLPGRTEAARQWLVRSGWLREFQKTHPGPMSAMPLMGSQWQPSDNSINIDPMGLNPHEARVVNFHDQFHPTQGIDMQKYLTDQAYHDRIEREAHIHALKAYQESGGKLKKLRPRALLQPALALRRNAAALRAAAASPLGKMLLRMVRGKGPAAALVAALGLGLAYALRGSGGKGNST